MCCSCGSAGAEPLTAAAGPRGAGAGGPGGGARAIRARRHISWRIPLHVARALAAPGIAAAGRGARAGRLTGADVPVHQARTIGLFRPNLLRPAGAGASRMCPHTPPTPMSLTTTAPGSLLGMTRQALCPLGTPGSGVALAVGGTPSAERARPPGRQLQARAAEPRGAQVPRRPADRGPCRGGVHARGGAPGGHAERGGLAHAVLGLQPVAAQHVPVPDGQADHGHARAGARAHGAPAGRCQRACPSSLHARRAPAGVVSVAAKAELRT